MGNQTASQMADADATVMPMFADKNNDTGSLSGFLADEREMSEFLEGFEDLESDDYEEKKDDDATDEKEEDLAEDELSMPDNFKLYLKSIEPYAALLSEEEETYYANLYQNGTDAEKEYAKEKLVCHNLRLVVSVAKKYNHLGIDLNEIVQEGNLGLMKAVDRFKPELGYRFSTYATWWIRQSIVRFLANNARTIRLPVHTVDAIRRIRKVINAAQAENREASVKEIAEKTQLSEDNVRFYLSVTSSTSTVSLDTKIATENSREGDENTIGDFIADTSHKTPEEETLQNSSRDALHQILRDTLSEKEYKIMSMRFGLDGNAPMTLEGVGNHFGVTRERIRQIEEKCLRKLRNPRLRKILAELYQE